MVNAICGIGVMAAHQFSKLTEPVRVRYVAPVEYHLGVRQLVDGVFWAHEVVGSSPTTQTIQKT